MVKILFFFTLLFIVQHNANSQNETYRKVRILFNDKKELQELGEKGLILENFIQNAPNSIDVEICFSEIDILIENDIDFYILEESIPSKIVKEHSLRIKSTSSDTVCGLKNFTYGTMGHFHNYEEIIEQLDSMKSMFPNLITTKETIGRSIEGRAIYAVKISDNPDINESTLEGVVYFDALHHAREPMSMESLLYFMWWLLENYNSNDEANYLINNRELHFIPIVNPDGYVYNQIKAPEGRGYWRKNRRDLGNGVFGVDLNRNYSSDFSDAIGSSSKFQSSIYHGQEAFSEPETRAVRDYLVKVKPKTAFTCHSFGQMILTPPGCNGVPKDSDKYLEYSSEFINDSFRGYGGVFDMLHYNACGTTMDYMHELGIYAWTPEIGTSFWPEISEFCSTVQNMLESYKYISHIAGSYTRLNNFELSNANGVYAKDALFVKLRVKK